MKPESRSRLRAATISAVCAAVVLATVLFWQDYRHGWPFSRHHDFGKPPVEPTASAPKEGSPASATARTALSVDTARLGGLGVRFERAKVEPVAQLSRAAATVVADEGRI